MSRGGRRRLGQKRAKAREASFQALVREVNNNNKIRKLKRLYLGVPAPYGWTVEYFPQPYNTEIIVRPSVRFERSCSEYRTGRCVVWFGNLDEATRFADGIQCQKLEKLESRED